MKTVTPRPVTSTNATNESTTPSNNPSTINPKPMPTRTGRLGMRYATAVMTNTRITARDVTGYSVLLWAVYVQKAG